MKTKTDPWERVSNILFLLLGLFLAIEVIYQVFQACKMYSLSTLLIFFGSIIGLFIFCLFLYKQETRRDQHRKTRMASREEAWKIEGWDGFKK